MKLRRNLRLMKQRGFTLLEMMVSLLILGIVTGAVFSQMSDAQQRMTTEQVKVDDFQQARDFVDQFFRDINQIGDPNIRLFDSTAIVFGPPAMNDSRLAVGLVSIGDTSIVFEGSVNGIGTVQSVQYKINGSGACALCLQRSQVDKVNGNPWGQATNWGTEVNDVQSNPIFRYFDVNNNPIAASPVVDISTAAGAQTIANVKTIRLSLRIQNPAIVDEKTRQPIESVFEGEVSLNNCSMAVNGQPMSCQ
jgi:prepilin-type N-terminal cleavage/methylation domain-containing protein